MVERRLEAVILVDSNILIDVLDDEQDWRDWSLNQLVGLVDHRLAVNQIAFAEVAPRMKLLSNFHETLESFEIVYEPFAEDAAFLAGRAFLAFRAGRRDAKMVLPDFFIGGHAQVAGATVLTRDPRFYRTYFPHVPLITPETTP
jgi:predicted nucleic acid-binding protein